MNRVKLSTETREDIILPKKWTCYFKHIAIYVYKEDCITLTAFPYTSFSRYDNGILIDIHIGPYNNKRKFFSISDYNFMRYRIADRRRNFKYIWERREEIDREE